jgi:hypothetical protein
LLEAADEIVWSCYKQPFRTAELEKTPAHPLPFVATVYSPYAIPREEPPQDMRSDVDAEFLADVLREMPIPVTAIPALAVAEPWWLGYLAHEMGHHVQFDFDGGSWIDVFGDILDAAGGERWSAWVYELFADVFSLLMIGPWALWALAELVWGEPADMLADSNPRYPCPLVRLMFMAAVADELGLDGRGALRGLTCADLLESGPVVVRQLDLREKARADLGRVAAVAVAAAGARHPTYGRLADLAAFKPVDFRRGGIADLWGDVFAGRADMAARKDLWSARLVLSGGIGAWSRAREIAEPETRDKKRRELQTNLVAKIVENREEITRAAAAPLEVELDRHNDRLAGLLLASDIPGQGL